MDSGEVTVEHRGTKEMWSDILTKPKQGIGMRQDRANLMNCPIDYDDEVERMKTHPKMLRVEGPVDPSKVAGTVNAETNKLTVDRRSVLADKQNRKVTWNTCSDRVGKNTDKVRSRHVELVIARVLRDKRLTESIRAARGRE